MIGGNTKAILQVSTTTKNEIGEKVQAWHDAVTIKGFLDLSSGDSKYTTYNAKIQESTHIFVADYVALDASIKAENSRLLVNGGRYDVMLIDDPMGLHKQLEIYLKYTGGQ
jgi:head-tail adaptor